MSIFDCGWCGHNGVHGEHIPTDSKIRRCTQCQKCEAEMKRERSKK